MYRPIGFLACLCLLVEECLSPTPLKYPLPLYFSPPSTSRDREIYLYIVLERESFDLCLICFLSLMERHRCKLCTRSFINGRALGGHMRSHLAPLPIPPKPKQQPIQLGDYTESNSSFSSSDEDEEERESAEGKGLIYGLRENPKKSFKLMDPEFLDAGSVVDQDRESETESTRNPTRRRSKRTRKMWVAAEPETEDNSNPKQRKPSSTESVAELETLSSISDTFSAEDEDVALCLIMLSRDIWPSQTRGIYQCDTCKKVFKSFQALGGHRTSHKKMKNWSELKIVGKKNVDEKVHECPICFKVFGSGQALGGHKRSHVLGSSSTSATAASISSTTPKQLVLEFGENLVMEKTDFGANSGGGLKLIDLNLPATMEDEDFSQMELDSAIPSSIETINSVHW